MNERTPAVPPVIEPLPLQVTRPLWSVMIPSYNCSAFLKETIKSVLANDAGLDKMQIEVIDDCSTDDNIEELVKEIGKGRVAFFRQKKNVGSLRNFETCINRAKGEWVHILHGDDKIGEGFYREIESLFTSHPEAGAAFTGIDYINEKGNRLSVHNRIPGNYGIVKDWLLQIATNNLVQPPAIVVKRKVYEKLGSFFAVHYGEDWEMWVRIAANFPVAYSPKSLAMYRYLRNNSISTSYLKSGHNTRDILKVINIIQDYLPEHEKKKLKNEARKNYSCYFAYSAQLIYKDYNNKQAAIQQAKLALGMHFNRITIFSLIKLYIKFIIAFFGFKSFLDKR
jgi:glycosyltransferase involved in cell wall biosynthesis